MTDQSVQADAESQPDGKKVTPPAAAATTKPLIATTSTSGRNGSPMNASNMALTTSDSSSTTTNTKSNKTKKAATTTSTKTGVTSPQKSSPSTALKYTHPVPTKGAPVIPPVPIHHPYAHHHYYAYHQHMAAANANSTDPKAGVGIKSSKPTPPSIPSYNPAQYKKVGMGGDTSAVAANRGKQGPGAPGQPPPPPPMYPPPPPHLPPHHHAYQAWAAYRYAQQHSQYHGGPPPPPPGPPLPWNADAYAAAHQAYAVAASKSSAATSKKGNKKVSCDNGATATGSVGAVGAPTHPPHHHYPPHSGPVPPPPSGPYRYSDPTLRRDALSRISSTSDKSKIHPNCTATTKVTSASSSLSSHNNSSGSPSTPVSSSAAKNGIVGGPVMVTANHTPPDPATLHMLELEARAEGATSPSQIEDFHREEVTTMGCTCKKTKCLKLYCQCFAVKIYCGSNCRCLSCNNSPQHEDKRQEAIRAILSRNPSAFDTKFQKNNKKIVSGMVGPGGIIGHARATRANPTAPGGVGGLVHGGLGVMDIPHARTISHKVGCKCRKSACMKKYCECYAGNVKCSANCRCIGCKNRPPGEFGPPPGSHNSVSNPNSTANVKIRPSKNVMTTPVKKEPSWMMNAAQNLTFLKHGSAEKPKRIISRAPSEAGSMPSLVSSSEESPGVGGSKTHSQVLNANEVRSIPEPNSAERAAVNALLSSEKTAVNALLMAAIAMTEMSGNGSTNNENRTDTSKKNGVILTPSVATTSPLNNRQNNHSNNSSPEATNRSDEHFETPQRNLLKKFMSPKRKASDRNAGDRISSINDDRSRSHVESSELKSQNVACSDDYRESDHVEEDSPKREHPGDGTPSLLQKVKRSRLGSLKKGTRLLERERSNGDQYLLETTSTTNEVLPMEMSTPAKGTNGVKIADLTPVSARCIDFKKMRVNDSSSDPAIVDSVAL